VRRLGLIILGSISVVTAALVADSMSDTAAAGWLALVAVGLGAVAVVIAGIAWAMTRPTTASAAQIRRLTRLAVAVVALAALAAAALVIQAALGGAAAGWTALVSVVLLAALAVAAWALDLTT
jgi:hypothetical protein